MNIHALINNFRLKRPVVCILVLHFKITASQLYLYIADVGLVVLNFPGHYSCTVHSVHMYAQLQAYRVSYFTGSTYKQASNFGHFLSTYIRIDLYTSIYGSLHERQSTTVNPWIHAGPWIQAGFQKLAQFVSLLSECSCTVYWAKHVGIGLTCCLPSVYCNEDVGLIEAGPWIEARIWLYCTNRSRWHQFNDLR